MYVFYCDHWWFALWGGVVEFFLWYVGFVVVLGGYFVGSVYEV